MVFAVSPAPFSPPRLTLPVTAEMTAAEGALDLLPIPAALVERAAGTLRLEATNRALLVAGLASPAPGPSLLTELGGRIAAFFDGEGTREGFPWALGDSVDRRYFHVLLARIYHRGGERCLLTLVDQTAELRTEHSLRREMATDSLTGLPNRAGFGDQLDTTIVTEPSRYALLMIDLDRFARVNACMGGIAGDELLITVARRLRGALRAADVLARTGGDEFGILLRLDAGPSDAEHVVKRIRDALATPFRLADFEIRVSCSIGVAFGADGIEDPEELIRHAQFAVKRSKSSGRAETYQPSAFDAARARFGMETALRRALDRRQLRLAYQPICDLATGRVSAFEALARWTDEDGRVIPPAEFIPVAEESGLIIPLGRWALDEAVRTLAAWEARAGGSCGVDMSVNLSAVQLQRDQIAPLVRRVLADHGLKGNRLKLELTESVLVADPDRIARTMESLRSLGVTLAMDDFGTGYSNLAYLQMLPIDILKIDRSFVTGMFTDRDKAAIVHAVLSLAKALHMRTVAEGVETLDCARMLGALGCTYGQGFYFGGAMDTEAAFACLIARNVSATAASASSSTRG